MRDEWFIRGDVPMTKSEVRAVSLSKLELSKDSVLLDIGAGTGSVSVEALLAFQIKKVYAFEKKTEAISLLKQNREKADFSEKKLTIVEGAVPECFFQQYDTSPTHGFIGGTSGSMEAVIDYLLKLNPGMRIVINIIALETLAEMVSILKKKKIEAEIVSVQTARAVKAGGYHLMQGQNPVYVISFGGEDGA